MHRQHKHTRIGRGYLLSEITVHIAPANLSVGIIATLDSVFKRESQNSSKKPKTVVSDTLFDGDQSPLAELLSEETVSSASRQRCSANLFPGILRPWRKRELLDDNSDINKAGIQEISL